MWYKSEKNVIKIKFSCIPESASVKIRESKAHTCLRQSTKIEVITEELAKIFF